MILSFTDRAFTLFLLLSDCHSSLFWKESVISVFYSRLPQFFEQNTKQDNTLCSRVGSKNKENISLQSYLSLSLFIQKMFSAPAQIGRNTRKLNSRAAIFDVERKALQYFFSDAMGETESHIDMSYTKRLSPAVYSFLS